MAQKLGGNWMVKKFAGSTPEALRNPLTMELICACNALPSVVPWSGLPFAVAQVLYSALVGLAAVGALLKMSVPPCAFGTTLKIG